MLPLLSDFDSFPVNPNLDTIGNCLAGVKNKADIFVLIVGGRYGSQTESGKSVTNMEYLEAKAKRIPCYVFVQKPLLTALTIWRKNPSGDFSGVADSPKLFEFIESLRDPKENWVFPFESAQDIIETLRKQFAYLFMDALSFRGKIMNSNLPENLQNLSGPALLLVTQKPVAWEHQLFSQVLSDELCHLVTLKKDLDYGLVLGRTVRLHNIAETFDWITRKVHEIVTFVESVGKLVNVVLAKAVGAPGEPGNAEEIVYAGRRLATAYRSILDWTVDFKHVQVDKEFDRIFEIVSRLPRNIITEIEDFSTKLQQKLSEAIRQYESTKEPLSLNITLDLTCPDTSDYYDELRRIAKLLGYKGEDIFNPNVGPESE
jgi:predicted house-cleaning noncanonical NTP pyrophosphatase (MazG superfamily)